jgi:cytochrome c553
MKRALVHASISIAAGLLIAAGPANAGDPEAGKFTAQTCLGCHGVPGNTNVYPTYHTPKLGGQNAEYIVDAMEAYRNGDREHALMQAQARSLSDEQIRDIAAYFANAERR